MRLFSRLQSHFENLYELRRICDVNDYVITDPVLAGYLDSSINPRAISEKLLIQQSGDMLNLSLYFDKSLFKTLKKNDPASGLNDRNLGAFLSVTEGISHFVYLTWNASHDQPVSLFELELQAEVDKFVTALMIADSRFDLSNFNQLFRQIFVNVKFDDSLTPMELNRYRNANKYAALYCKKIKALFKMKTKKLYLNELRRFYRKNHWTKTNYISSR